MLPIGCEWQDSGIRSVDLWRKLLLHAESDICSVYDIVSTTRQNKAKLVKT